MTTYYTSNDPSIGFDATTAGTLPTDWAALAGTWKVGTTAPVGAHAQSFASTSGADGDVALLTGIAAEANMQVAFTQTLPAGVTAAVQPIIGPILRSDSGYNNCYTWIITPSGTAGQLELRLFKRISGGYSQIGSTTNSPQSFATSGAITLKVLAQANGTAISITVWPLGTAQPGSADYTVTDSSISAAGCAGIYNALNGTSGVRALDDFLVSDTSGDAETISVTTPGTETAGNNYTYSGSYTGTQPAALDFEFDSAGYGAASSPTISGGTWSFTATAPSAGSHTISVRDHNVTSVSGTSGSFTTNSSETIAVTTPAAQTGGTSYTYSGTYTGGPPTALDYEFDGAGYGAATSPTISGGTWSFTATAPSAGTHTISVRDHTVTSVSGTSGNFTTAVAAITVTTPGTEGAGGTYTYAGTYTGAAPAALDYEFDSAGFAAASSPTISGGTWSFSATAPAIGTHTLTVRDHTITSTSGTSGSFSTVSESIAVNTPPAQTSATSYSYSGTYSGGPPTALDYQFDSAGYAAASSPTISGGTWSFTATSPGAGTHTLSVRDHNNTGVSGTSGSFTTAVETITVTTPASQTAGSPYSYAGTYTGGDPGALDFEFDSAGYGAASSPTIGGGAFSFTATAPSAGTHTISVRDHTNTGVSGTSGSFSTGSASISIATPSGLVIAGQSLTVSGTYTGGAPAGLNYQIDSGGYTAAPGPTISGGAWSFSITAPAFGSHTIEVQESNATGVTATTGSFTVSAAPNNAAMVYSPYNWNVTGGSATTINAGAYFRTLFSGASCVLNFNVANMCSPTSEIWWRVDDGPLTAAAVAATVTVTIPTVMQSNGDVPYHLLEVLVKSTTETQNRWNSVGSSTGTAVIFQGLTLASGAALVAPRTAPKNLLIYGDSITEGVRTCGEAASNDTDRNDAWQGWAYRLGALLGAEVGVVGFGATGVSTGGSGNVPALPSSYNLLYAGAARTFSPAPDLVAFNEGTNDGGANIVAAMTGVLNAIIAACPGKPIAVLRPFNGNQAGNLQTAIAACNNPSACTYIDTTGFLNSAYGIDSLSLHPSGPNNLALIAPQLAAALRPLLAPSGSASPVFRGGFQRGLLG